MKMSLPDEVTLIEVGPRDGFQFEKPFIPTEFKIEIIKALASAGIRQIQVTSFVHPQKVPQMADAEELIRRLPALDGVVNNVLVLNTAGVRRDQAAGLRHIEISISASDTHSRNNTGMAIKRAMAQATEMIRLAQSEDMHVRAGIQCVFGCVHEGQIAPERIHNIVGHYMSLGVDAIALSDTTGMANPIAVMRLLELLLPQMGSIPIILHFHDTRGLGLANVLTALQCGVTCFDTALAGMGGCPFVPGAAGNIATEDTLHLMLAMGIATGIDINRVAQCSLRLERLLNKTFPGKVHGLLK
jgi:hydroxymethylglutaryl-CoA lyase